MKITKASIEAAAIRIAPYIHNTPIMTCKSINALYGLDLYFKCENFQKIGAFKIRGGMNASLQLTKEQLEKGVATHSSGNHAQALAFAAKMLGIKAYIVMPESSPQVKVNAVRGYGAEVTICASNQAARESTLQSIVDQTGATFIHPYDNDEVITGQATCVKEIIEAMPDIDIVVTPVGGGGLIAGTGIAVKALSNAQVLGAEPEQAKDAWLGMQSGERLAEYSPNTIADGLRATVGVRNFAVMRETVDDILLCSEQRIIEAMRLIWTRLKVIVEPSCAVPLAAIMDQPEQFQGKRVAIILTGGNVDLDGLPW